MYVGLFTEPKENWVGQMVLTILFGRFILKARSLSQAHGEDGCHVAPHEVDEIR